MKILFAGTAIAGADDYDKPSGISVNGVQVVTEANFFRAAIASVFARGQKSTTLQFSVEKQFGSLRECEVFMLTYFAGLPTTLELCEVQCGVTGDIQSCFMEDCAIEAVPVSDQQGVSVRVDYTIRGGIFTTDVPGDIPGEVDDGLPIFMRRQSVAIANGATGGTIAFSSPLASTPYVVCTLTRPGGSDSIWAMVVAGSESVNGFDYELSGAVPDTGYFLSYVAVQ